MKRYRIIKDIYKLNEAIDDAGFELNCFDLLYWGQNMGREVFKPRTESINPRFFCIDRSGVRHDILIPEWVVEEFEEGGEDESTQNR